MKPMPFVLCISLMTTLSLRGEEVQRARPAGWDGLVFGGRFMDRFLPLPEVGPMSSDLWGQAGVKPRCSQNGLEASDWSYWGGTIHEDTSGTFHLYVCRWREDNPKGHMAWPRSEVVHAVARSSVGPYVVQDVVGEGHNPEMHQLKDGRYFLYASKNFAQTYYLSDDLNGPWELKELTYDPRQRPIVDHMANNSFVRREDGSMLMVGRGGGIWVSQTGLPPYKQISAASVYPPFDGRYEDPVIWKTEIQYHLVVNDWLGRRAYYMRSRDGITWKLDAGEAYVPGIARYPDGRVEEWYKFERIKVLQDEYGRAVQSNFAVCDIAKKEDLGRDNHSSKNICIPLVVGRRIELLNKKEINNATSDIKLLVKAERGFDPLKDLEVESLRFGASEEVDFGRGCVVTKTEVSGRDLLITFDGNGNGLTVDHFAAKLLGRSKDGTMLFGYARLPWVDYIQSHLSSKFPECSLNHQKLRMELEIENFGQVRSDLAAVRVEYLHDGEWTLFAKGPIDVLEAYKTKNQTLWGEKIAERNATILVRVTISQASQADEVLEGPVIIR